MATIADLSGGSGGWWYDIVGEYRLADPYRMNLKQAQTFVVIEGNWNVTSVSLYLLRSFTAAGDPEVGNLTLSICEDSPTGAVLGTSIVDRLTVSTEAPSWVSFSFSDVALSSGNTYCLVLSCPSGLVQFDDVDTVKWLYRSAFYSSGARYSRYDAIEWTLDASDRDCVAIVYGDAAAPSQPTTPSPANNATEVDFSGFTLNWVDGGGADTYDVYIGPSGSLTLKSGAQIGTSYVTNINEVPYGEKIYWRVDATNEVDTTTGNIWNFAAYPGAPINPTPTNDASGITLDDTVVTWEPGANTDSFDVYFRPYGEFFEKIASDTTELSVSTYDSAYSYGWLYLWCVIAKNQFGLNYSPPTDFGIGYGGTIWQFNAMVFDPPLPSGITLDWSGDDPTGEQTGTPTGENFMMAIRGLVAAANNRIWYEDI